jgi:hypothetical protein
MSNEPPNKPVAASQPSASTGPRTEAGKATSSQNARKHDLCSRTLHLAAEEWEEYNDMCEGYRRDLQPANDVEQTLIDEICFNYWRLQQAREVELRIITGHPRDLPTIALYIRYRTGYERGYTKRSTNSNRRSASANRKKPASLDFVPQNRKRQPPRQLVPKPRLRQLRLRHKMSPEPPSSLRTN